MHYYRCMNKFVCLFIDKQAHVAQLVERILGKDEVGGSIPLEGSIAANNKPLINLSLLNNINHG